MPSFQEMYQLCAGQMHLSAFITPCASGGVFLHRISSRQHSECPTGCRVCLPASYQQLGGGVSEGRQLFITLLHMTLSDEYRGFYNGLARVLDKLVHLRTVSVLRNDKMSEQLEILSHGRK